MDSALYPAGICEAILHVSVVPGTQMTGFTPMDLPLRSWRSMRYFLSDEHVEPRIQQGTQSKGYRQKLKALTMYFCSV